MLQFKQVYSQFIFWILLCSSVWGYSQGDTIKLDIEYDKYIKPLGLRAFYIPNQKSVVLDSMGKLIIERNGRLKLNVIDIYSEYNAAILLKYESNYEVGVINLENGYHFSAEHSNLSFQAPDGKYNYTAGFIFMKKDSQFKVYSCYRPTILYEGVFDEIIDYCDNIIVRKGDRYGVYNDIIGEVLPPIYKKIRQNNQLWEFQGEDNKWGYIQHNTKRYSIIPYNEIKEKSEAVYDSILSLNFLLLKKEGKWGVFFKEYSFFTPFEYDAFQLNEIDSYCTTGMSRCDKLNTHYLTFPCIAKKQGKYGVIGIKNSIFIPFIYDTLLIQNNNKNNRTRYLASKNKKWGIITTKETILPFKFDSILYAYNSNLKSANDNFWVKKRKKWYLINEQKNTLLSTAFDSIQFVRNNQVLVWKNKKCGLFSQQKMTYLIPLIYDKIEFSPTCYENCIFTVKKDNIVYQLSPPLYEIPK